MTKVYYNSLIKIVCKIDYFGLTSRDDMYNMVRRNMVDYSAVNRFE